MLRAAASRAAGLRGPLLNAAGPSGAGGWGPGLRSVTRINSETGADDLDAMFNETLVRLDTPPNHVQSRE